MSVAEIAEEATKLQLTQLAALLLDREPNFAKQIDVLLKLKEIDKALAKAAQSQQPDLSESNFASVILPNDSNSALIFEISRILHKLSAVSLLKFNSKSVFLDIGKNVSLSRTYKSLSGRISADEDEL